MNRTISSRVMRAVSLFLTVVMLFTALTACSEPTTDESGKEDSDSAAAAQHTVTFKCNNGTSTTLIANHGAPSPMPQNPTKPNHTFNGWYVDESCRILYNVYAPVESDLTLYAGYTVDKNAVINTVARETIRGMVTVTATSYNKFLFWETDKTRSQGSGVIIKLTSSGRAYLLTNCHVAETESGRDHVRYKIEDSHGNTYDAKMHVEGVTGTRSINAEYDLALLYFDGASSELHRPINIAEKNARIGEEVVCLGTPKGQANTFTIGSVTAYQSIALKDTPAYKSNVTFPVIKHTAYSNNGSSGGALLNLDLELVGIHYAAGKNDNGEYICGYAVPIEKVIEFINSTCLAV